jgi:Zn-dependent peptidase ImmA (M78 family)/DNA-binding XRE family transcriptional regulator
MPSSREFVGQRLRTAREFRDMTLRQLADSVSVSFGLISHYEKGRKKEPSPDLVAALGEILGVEPTFFYEPIEDVWLEKQCTFRHRSSTPQGVKTRARAHGTLVSLIISHLASMLRFPAYNVPEIVAASQAEIELAASRCRSHWRLGLDTPILHMGRVLETAGVIIVKHLPHSEKIDAFSRRGQTNVVILNTAKTSTSRWIWDLAHELGHLVMHDPRRVGTKECEDQADYFAGSFLLPRKAFSREFSAASFSWHHVFDVKRRWRVSAAAIIRRAHELRLIDAVTYRQAFKYRSLQGWTRDEPEEPPFQGPELLPDAFRKVEQGIGETLASLCSKLHLKPATFTDLTGIAVEEPPGARVVSLIPKNV